MSSEYVIIKDTREKAGQGWVFDNMELACLETGDYSIKGLEKYISVERKGSVQEFTHNLTEQRFEKELERLSLIKYAFVVCEFNFQLLKDFPVGSGIPKHIWKYLRVTPNFLLKRLDRKSVV